MPRRSTGNSMAKGEQQMNAEQLAEQEVMKECKLRNLVVRERGGMLNLRTPGLGGEWIGPMSETYIDLAGWLCPELGFE